MKFFVSFLTTLCTLLLMVPGTINRIFIQIGIDGSAIMIVVRGLLIFCVFLIYYGSIWEQGGFHHAKVFASLQFLIISFLLLISFEITGVITNQGLAIRLSGYFLFLLALLLLTIPLQNGFSFFSVTTMNITIVVYAFINVLLGVAQYLTGNSIISIAGYNGQSTVATSQLNDVSSLGFLAWNGGYRAFGFLDSGMALGLLLILAFGIVSFKCILMNKYLATGLEWLFFIGIIMTLTRNVYFLFLMMIVFKHYSKYAKPIFLIGLVIQWLPIMYANVMNVFSFLQTSFFGTFLARLRGIVFFQDYYSHTLIHSLFGSGYQYDNIVKAITLNTVDNQGLALYLDVGAVGVMLIYLTIYLSISQNQLMKANSALYCMITIFSFFGIANNHLTFFAGILLLLNLCNSTLDFRRGRDNDRTSTRG